MRRFILCAAESGIDIFRLHDPLNDVDDLAGPIAAVREAGAQLYAGLVYADAPGGERPGASGRGACPSSAPTACCCTTPPARSTRPPPAS